MKEKLTLVKVIDNDSILDISFDEILKSNAYKTGLIKLLIVDLLHTKKTQDYLEKNDLKKFLNKTTKLSNVFEIYEEVKKDVNTRYVNFSTTSSFIKGNELDKVIKLINDTDCVILQPKFYPLDNLKYVINYLKIKNHKFEEVNYLSIDENIEFFNPLLDSYFFDFKKVKDIPFEVSLKDNSLIKFILDSLLKIKNYLFYRGNYYYIKPLENDFGNNIEQYKKDWYLLFTKDFAIPYLKKNNCLWIQNVFLYLIAIRYASNMNARNKNVLDNKELEIFECDVKESLKYIDYNILSSFKSAYIGATIIDILIDMKANSNLQLKKKNNEIILTSKNNNIVDIKDINLDIMVMEYDHNCLCIDAEIVESIFIQEGAHIKAYINGQDIPIKENSVYTHTKVFNKIKHTKYSFHLEVPKELFNEKKNKICFKYMYKNIIINLPIRFNKPLSKINTAWKNSYFRFDKYILIYNKENFELIIKRKKIRTIVRKELGLIFEYLFKSKKKKLGLKAVGLRVLFWLTKPFCRKKVWISFDKLFKGGDNGEYFYHYVNDNLKQKNIKMCYVINGDSKDYQRLKKENNILKFRSIKHYLNVLKCQYMFATHANPYDYNGFTSGVEKYFRDLLTFKTFCIQHGLSVNQIAKFQNRVYANTKLYFCASKYEIKNLSLPEYDYSDYDALRLTGVPRYDGLINNEKKIILITPTWRQSSSSKLVHLNMARQYNKEFKDSSYYKVYNSLINDKKLINCAKKYGYKIVYLLHPAVSSQIDDFEADNYIDIIAATSNMSYEKILTESSLMVTDYSGVQFDFAYMRKPIIYYHETSLPPHYEESSFIYETMGFGPIIDNQEELVNSLCDYMKNNCQMNLKYIKRADDFFKYDDFNNCKRIVEEVEKYNETQK